jgi:hypothetical protein
LGLRYADDIKPKKPPTPDYNGVMRVYHQLHFLLDDKFEESDDRHVVAMAHCFLAADQITICSSGELDPKKMLLGQSRHIELTLHNPECHLCVSGDMIPEAERFRGSKYRPK